MILFLSNYYNLSHNSYLSPSLNHYHDLSTNRITNNKKTLR